MGDVLSFIHLSDIHFGQKRGAEVHVHQDVRQQLVKDVEAFYRPRKEAPVSPATGVLVTGDIAYSGKRAEYKQASAFLDNIATAAGCKNTDVCVAPGNHDIDLQEITHGMMTSLAAIEASGETELQKHFEDDRDRARLYDKLKDYAVFAEGYGCPLDGDGGHAGEKDYDLGPGRVLRFVSWNSALACSGKDKKGRLLLGAKQRVLAADPGVERIVLCHHPLPWFADESDARRYLKNRARVFLSGHEHVPEIAVEVVEENCHFLHLAAGAVTAPDSYEYTYNILDFEWLPNQDELSVTVYPRVWVDSLKRFASDSNRLDGKDRKRCILGCPQFRAAPRRAAASPGGAGARDPETYDDVGPPAGPSTGLFQEPPAEATVHEDDHFRSVRRRFFHELSRTQRIKILVEIGALPATFDGIPTMAIERKALELLRNQGKVAMLETAIKLERGPTTELSARPGDSRP